MAITITASSAESLSNTLANGNIFVGNGSNQATGVAVTGVIAISDAGVTSYASAAFGALNISTTGTLAAATGTFSNAGAQLLGVISTTVNQESAIDVQIAEGSTTGDAYQLYRIASGTSWAAGLDNSASDAYVISQSTALGINNVLSISTSGILTMGLSGATGTNLINGNLNLQNDLSGASKTLTVRNQGNDAGADARVFISSGAATGDPYIRYEISGVTNWVAGVNNASSDIYSIGTGVTISGHTSRLNISTAGLVTIPGALTVEGQDINHEDTIVGDFVSDLTTNLDNSSGTSHARNLITVGGASGGDPLTTYTISGAQSWTTGVDNSVSDRFGIDVGTGLGSTPLFSISTSGVITIGESGNAQEHVFHSLTAAADTNTPTFIATPTGISGTQATWLRISIAGTTSYIPVWQ